MLETDEQLKKYLENVNTYEDLRDCLKHKINHEICRIIMYISKTGDKLELLLSDEIVVGYADIDLNDAIKMMNNNVVNYCLKKSYYVTPDPYNISYVIRTIYSNYYDWLNLDYTFIKMTDEELDFIMNYLNLTLSPITLRNKIIDNNLTGYIIVYKTRFANNQQKIAELRDKLYLHNVLYNNIEEFHKMRNESRYDLLMKIKLQEQVILQLITFIDVLDTSAQDIGENNAVVSRVAIKEIMDVVNETIKN